MRQWWEIKSENFDTILFFKVGKFYELYHMDAVIGVRELNLVFMRGDFAHAGFPEVAFGKYSQTLVQKGHKVARIEQTETPQMMENRIKTMMISPSKFDRVVKREVCALISQGTRTVGFFEGESPNAESSYLLAIKEKSGSCSQNETEFGVCFIDTCIGVFHLGQFTDDRQCSRLRTLLAHYPPVQLLVERGNLSFRSNQLLNQVLSLAVKDTLAADSEFWDCTKTLKYLSEEGYFDVQVPEQLQQMISKDDSLGMSPGDKYELALSSLGACIWTLKRSLIERDILLMNQFEEFVPLDELKLSCDSMSCDPGEIPHQRMILDDMALYNLGVISNEPSSAVGTLLHTIDKCSTLFGHRLLKQWISAPLCNPSAIDERLDAVDDLMTNQLLRCDIKDKLKSLPDMERLLRRIYMLGSDAKDENHPDSRAILFESVTYNKRKIKDFISLLNGFKNCLDIVELVNSHIHNISSKLLKKLITLTQDGGLFPDLSEYISFFNKAFDHDRALKEGAIFPNQGVNKEYDESLQEIEDVKNELQTYLQQQRKRLNCKNVVYWGNGRNRYQLEVPEHIEAPEEYELKSQKKGSLRYYTVTIENLLALLTAAEEKKDTSLRNSMKTIFNTFSQQFSLWDAAIRCIARVDVLVSMATYSASIEGSSCRPRVIGGEAPYIDIRQGKHPCITETFSGDDFIPNDAIINSQKTPGGKMCILVTGPNMGGKSTLMRQTGLLTILAHLGSHVPAECCHLSPVDRIFTRLGASDNIMHGESTFFVEANETSIILHHATINSLVLLDELGRGTATYDGTSIACAVLDYLANNISCRTLFSTHYHGLVNRFKDNPYVQLGHMACMADDEDDVTLLYKFMDGACPKSYGFNAARLAGVPPKVIELAKKKANEFELNNRKLRIFRSFVNKLITPSLIGRELQELCIQ
jgi:DNA mismatch repair protein MSH6